MTVLLCLSIALVAYGLGAAAVCALSNREPAAGMPAVARRAGQAALRRLLGARPKNPRHAHAGGHRA